MLFWFLYILFFAIVLIVLFVNNKNIKDIHQQNINKLEGIIESLYEKQNRLNDKVMISNEYNTNYNKEMKLLGNEVVELQKVFINIIVNENN